MTSSSLWQSRSAWGAAVVGLAMAGCGWTSASPEESPDPCAGRPAVSDAGLEEALAPEASERSCLCRGADGRYYYVAHLSQPPSSDFAEDYAGLIASRGFLIRSIRSSPHVPPTRVEGYEFFLVRPTSVQPLVVRSRRFMDFSDDKGAFAKSHPWPISLEGRRLVVRLGADALVSWQERTLVPAEDAVAVKELPFPRYPGAVLTRAFGHSRSVGRNYAVRRTSLDSVLDHYFRVCEAFGRPQRRTNDIRCFAADPANPVEYMGAEKGSLLAAPGLALHRVAEAAPELLRDLPQDLTPFTIRVNFATPDDAETYRVPVAEGEPQPLPPNAEREKGGVP